MSMTLSSSAFKQNAYIPMKHSCDGPDVSPELSWAGLPFGAKSLALVLDDPDAPAGGWVHWVLFDIPPEPPVLKENAAKVKTLPDGSRHGLSWGADGGAYSRIGYYGPCPPPGKPHRYIFRLYALNKMLGLPAGTAKEALLKAMEGHILARAELTGLYRK